MTLTVQSVRSVGFGMLIEQISRGANFMLIGPQENVSVNNSVGVELELSCSCGRAGLRRVWGKGVFNYLEPPIVRELKS